jgi:predicted enzyme related to lactoylglutathione lyase
MSPIDVMDLGRMSLAQGSAGAMFAMWQPKGNQGTGLAGENGTVVWADLVTPDQDKAAEFYRELFDWKLVEGKNMLDAKAGQYFHIVHDGEFIGGIPPAHGGAPAHWVMYFAVPECQAAIAKATSLGARVVSGPMTIEGGRQFAALADPQGAIFAIVNTVK